MLVWCPEAWEALLLPLAHLWCVTFPYISASVSRWSFSLFFFPLVLGAESRARHVLGKPSAPGLYLGASCFFGDAVSCHVSLCILGWFGTYCVAQAVLEMLVLLLSLVSAGIPGMCPDVMTSVFSYKDASL